MNKISVWLTVGVLAVASTAFAQYDARGMQKFNEGRAVVRQQQIERKAAQAQKEAALINKILKQGEVTPISYSISMSYMVGDSMPNTGNMDPMSHKAPASTVSHTTQYSKNGKINGREYHDGGKVYILLNRNDWEDMYDECMPGWLKRALQPSYISQQVIKTKKGAYVKSTHGLLDHEHYTVNNKKYTVITFSQTQKKK